MASVDKVLEIARGELGKTEAPPNSNLCKYSRWYPMPGQPWCAMFVSWVLDKAGVDGYKHAYTPAGADLFRQQRRWSNDPYKGAIAYMDFPDSTHRIQHVGIVESINGDVVTCIEGNTAVGNDDNGGKVMRRERSKGLIVGYGLPPYVDGKRDDDTEVRDWLDRGDSGSDVRMLQRHLNVILDEDLEEDGDFGPMTEAAVKTLQRSQGRKPDGKLGAKELAAIERLFKEAKEEHGDHLSVLTRWDEGKAVRRAQARLSELGFEIDKEERDSGLFGESTAEAVKKFKTDNGWPDRPIVGQRAWRKLLQDVSPAVNYAPH